jgi:hypothetical protein
MNSNKMKAKLTKMMKNNNNSLRVRGKEILAPFRFE